MPTLNITQTYADGDVLFEADLDNIIDDIETFLNITKIDNSNIQDGGIDASLKLTDASITTSKIASNAVTTAKINDAAVTTAKINDSAVTTAKINDSAVTYAKLAVPTLSSSSSTGTFTNYSNTSYADVTNLSVTGFVTTGRPLLITIQGSITLNNPSSTSDNVYAYYRLLQNGVTEVAAWSLYCGDSSVQVTGGTAIIQPAAGTYSYKVQVYTTNATNDVTFYETKLHVLEL